MRQIKPCAKLRVSQEPAASPTFDYVIPLETHTEGRGARDTRGVYTANLEAAAHLNRLKSDVFIALLPSLLEQKDHAHRGVKSWSDLLRVTCERSLRGVLLS